MQSRTEIQTGGNHGRLCKAGGKWPRYCSPLCEDARVTHAGPTPTQRVGTTGSHPTLLCSITDSFISSVLFFFFFNKQTKIQELVYSIIKRSMTTLLCRAALGIGVLMRGGVCTET